MEIENLFRWDKPKTGIRARIDKELSTFWTEKWRLRRGFEYAVWAVIGIWYFDKFVFAAIYDGPQLAAAYAAVCMWFLMWCMESILHNHTRKLLHKTFKEWGKTIDQWGKTTMDLVKAETEKGRLQERIDNMLGPSN